MTAESRFLNFDGLRQPVELRGCDELIPHLPLVIPGWGVATANETDVEPVLTLFRGDDGFRLEGYWCDETLYRHDSVDALCALVAEVMRAYGCQDDRLLCLHAAAAVFGDRLVVFPSRYRDGKRILCAALAAAGTRLYCDDILPVSLDNGNGIAPGLAPRLRLPLPRKLALTMRRFIESRIRLQGGNYAYLELDHGVMAARGEEAPPGAFVLLERQEGAVAALEPIGNAEVLARAIRQNFALAPEAPVVPDVLDRLVGGARRFRLRYDRAEDAVALLQREFATWDDSTERGPAPLSPSPSADTNGGEIATGWHRRVQGIEVIEVDGNIILTDRDGAVIHRLNAIDGTVWKLLREPMTADEITGLLLRAYPDLDARQVRKNVDDLLVTLHRKQLLRD